MKNKIILEGIFSTTNIAKNIFKQKSSVLLPSFMQSDWAVQGINNREALGRGSELEGMGQGGCLALGEKTRNLGNTAKGVTYFQDSMLCLR